MNTFELQEENPGILGLPYARIIKMHQGRSGSNWIIYVHCPYCFHIHKHGSDSKEHKPSTKPYYGTRMSHCMKGEYKVY
jgi:hypothetical protein